MNAPLPFTVIKQLNLDIHHELIVDCFAGGGGNSVGIEMATGRRVDIAINHDEPAISMHAANHPETLHLREDIREVNPRDVTHGRKVGLLHLSPDCRDHSQSKGGQPRSKEIRGLTWQGLKWAGMVLPRVITLENVKQILNWGPLVAKRDKETGRVVRLDGSVAAPGERVPLFEQFLVPDPKRKGQYWRKFVADLRAMGYQVEWKILCAADFDTPTTRERLFMVARRDGKPIVWPESTNDKEGRNGKPKWRAAAEIIDWSISCPSIFTRKNPLKPATLARIAKGIKRFVLDNPSPFIVPLSNQGTVHEQGTVEPLRTVSTALSAKKAIANPSIVSIAHYSGREIVHDAADPLRTIMAATKGGEFALMTPVVAKFRGQSNGAPIAEPLPTITSGGQCKRPAGAAHAMAVIAPVLVQTGYGERKGQAPRALDIERPLGTIVAGAVKHAPVVAYLAQQNGGFNETPGHAAGEPMSTITNRGSQQQVVAASLATLRNNCVGRPATAPVDTMTAGGEHHAVLETSMVEEGEDHGLEPDQIEGAQRVAAFLMRYYGEGGQWSDPAAPLPTITTKDRLALVTVTLQGSRYVIVDIGLRMLTPAELYAAQGFPPDYIFDRGHDGRKFSKSAQVRMVGNSVCPMVTKALVEANLPDLCINHKMKRAA